MTIPILLLILLNLELTRTPATSSPTSTSKGLKSLVLWAPAADSPLTRLPQARLGGAPPLASPLASPLPLPAALLSAGSGEPFIKKMRFQVPESARSGSTIKVSCVYELNGASLHAMKLFKDDKEFYRYTPGTQLQQQQQQQHNANGAEEQRIAFSSPGLKVDLARSGDQDIWIRVLDKRAAGTYKCQVSIEDTFKSISAEKRMDVIERARTMPSASSGTAATSWLGSSAASPSSPSFSSHQQQRQAVQHQQSQSQSQSQTKNSRIPASFMQQQSTSGAKPQIRALGSKDSLGALGVIIYTILIIMAGSLWQPRPEVREDINWSLASTRAAPKKSSDGSKSIKVRLSAPEDAPTSRPECQQR